VPHIRTFPVAFAAVVALAFTLTTTGSAHAASASLEQVRNGEATSIVTPTPTWGSGNAGASNSHYLESHSIAYRTVMDGLPTDGTVIELIIGYNLKRSGSYAIDYLTHYQRLLPHVLFAHREPEVFDPLSGIAGVDATISTAPVPITTRNVFVDPDGADPDPAMPQPSTNMAALSDPERQMTLFGGTLLDVSYVSEGDPNLATSSSETQVKVRFKATSTRAVLAWGGHIACRWDWGFNSDGSPRSAGGISGSSYHMRLVTWTLGSLGNQDRSMSTDAVYPVPRCGISNAGPFCAGSTNIHAAPAGMESYLWTLLDNGSGATIVGSDTSLSVTVRTTTAGSYTLVVTTGASGFTKQCQTTVTVNAPVTADAGPDQELCASSPLVRLAGWASGGTGTWSGGAGTFSPNASDPFALYTPTAAEIAAGGVTLTLTTHPASGPCPAASDAMRITYRPAAAANAGADQTVCASSPQVTLAGSVGGGASGGAWSGGAGSFVPGNGALNATYVPTAAEIAAGGVTLTLTTNDPAGPCAPTSDDVRITILPSATADAGADLTVCAASPQATLAGTIGGGASSASWTGGSGSFNPGRTTLNAVYTPTAAEIAAGGVTLTLVTNDPAGPCLGANDAVRIVIDPIATANAGPDQTLCAGSPQAQLAGSVGGGASTGTWSGGAGGFTPSRSVLNAVYTPTAAEIAAGSVTLTLTTNDPAGPCGAASDPLQLLFQPSAIADAGPDRRVCASSPEATLAGAVSGGATSGTWSGGAGSFSPKPTTLNATYTPTAAEIAAGGVTLILTTNDPAGPCPATSDAMTLVIDPVTLVNAGPDQTVCASSPQVQLAGAVSGTVSSGTWSGGTGSFNPGSGALTAWYTPSAAEIAAGRVTLTLTSAASSSPCPPASDAVTITINAAATVNAGTDQIVCAVTPQVQLAGSVGSGATSGAWSGGSGTFSPSASVLSPIYMPTAAEVAAGSVTLTLTTNDPAGPCPPVSDQVRITFDAPAVTVASRTVCTGIQPVQLCATGTKGVAPFTFKWSNGATTPCITVADTGLYSVTMTDARGCVATGSGWFHQRECQGLLANTTTTCATFMDGTAQGVASEIHAQITNNVITNISPGVFFYFTKVTAPRSDFTVSLVQEKSSPLVPFCEIQQVQVGLYDGNCNRIADGFEMSPGQGAVSITNATAGQVFIISVKYSLKNLVGVTLPPSGGIHYDFKTVIDGQVVDSDPDGIDVGADIASSVGVEPSTDPTIALYRPMPNPFTSGMRMAYAVGGPSERVRIRVFDIAGRVVRTLADGPQSAGMYLVSWDGKDDDGRRVQGSIYFVHVTIGEHIRKVRVTFLD
jgi:hypothetical protein